MLQDAVQGATNTGQRLTWLYPDGVAVDLTGADIYGVKRNMITGEVRNLEGVLSVVDGAAGVFSWVYGGEDVGTAGRFVVQFTARLSGGDEVSIPLDWLVYERV